jgi:EAL domain-containing protein (putative c-di-GMP-specific phosphodiesterase class I)
MLRVVAEGVETEDVRAELRAAGCDMAQGYLFARPMPMDQLRALLTLHAPTQPASAF